MNCWLETLGVVVTAATGVFLGRFFSKLRESYWILGYLLSAALIGALVIIRWSDACGLAPGLLWFTTGRIKFVILSVAVTMGLTAPLSRLPHKFERAAICILMGIVVGWFCVLPFLSGALIKGHLSGLRTIIDSDGVCFQSKNYTCGPAAAVTALWRLGLAAQEGEIAILSHTNPITGTLPWCLYTALQERYGTEGLKCQYRYFDSIGQLKSGGVTLAAVKNRFLSDHCVAILEVSEQRVTIGDPVVGRMSMSYEEFEKIWRFSGIVLSRDFTQNI